MLRRIRALAAAALVVAPLALVGCSSQLAPDPAPSDGGDLVRTGRDPDDEFVVTARDLGIHSFSTQPQVPTSAIRLNCYPGWSAVNPVAGQYDWVEFDRIVEQAEAWGYEDILYVFCSTPPWAGEPLAGTDQAAFGPGTAQAPADMATFEAYVRAVAERYRGRIDGYEVWNEPGSPQFFTGTPEQMGEMTEIVSRTVDVADPAAYVVSAGFQTHIPDRYDEFVPDYFADLRARDWPIDAVSAHFYPLAEGTPATRSAQITRLQEDLDKYGAPSDLGLWDTEVNYNVDLPGGAPAGRISGTGAAAWTAQSYLDGWRLGVRRTYWYLWTAEYYGFPGIQMRLGDPATVALQTLGSWVIGTTFTGCAEADKVVQCRFRKDDGTEFTIAWSNKDGGSTISVAPGSLVCPVDGGVCTTRSGDLPVTALPLRIG